VWLGSVKLPGNWLKSLNGKSPAGAIKRQHGHSTVFHTTVRSGGGNVDNFVRHISLRLELMLRPGSHVIRRHPGLDIA